MGCQAASVHGTTFGPVDQRHPIDQGHVPVPWKRKRQTLSHPKPTVRTSALALNAWTSLRRYDGYVSKPRIDRVPGHVASLWRKFLIATHFAFTERQRITVNTLAPTSSIGDGRDRGRAL